MKKYLTKAYLTQFPVVVFSFVLFINLVSLVHALIVENWVTAAADVAIIVILINWFIMWNMYERASRFAEEMMDENWEYAKRVTTLNLAITQIVKDLGVPPDEDGTIDLAQVKKRIEELKSK